MSDQNVGADRPITPMTSATNPRLSKIESGEAFVPEVGAEPFPGYKLVRKRGVGAFATVWEATAPGNTSVAVKFMSSQQSATTARELRTVQAIHRLDHPHLLRTRHVWSLPGTIAIAMDLAEASLLDLFLLYVEEFQQSVDVKKVCWYLHQAAEGLDFLNARRHRFDGRTVGYQHGDIKPNNILLVGERALLADYGLAVPTYGSTTPTSRQGTLEYAAPELFNGIVAESSDQFSLAVTYYLMRAGAFPFPAPPKAPPRGYMRPAPDLGLALAVEQPILMRALSPVPQDRYPSCVEFMAAILQANNFEVRLDPIGRLKIQPVPQSDMSRIKKGSSGFSRQ